MTNAGTPSRPENDADAVKPKGEAGARHGQVSGVWRVLLISLGLAVAAFLFISAVATGW